MRGKWQRGHVGDLNMSTTPQQDWNNRRPKQRWTSQFRYGTIHDVQVCSQEVLRMPQKNEVKASEVLHLPRQNDLNMLTWKMKTVSQDQQAGFHNIVQVNKMLRLTQNWRHLVLWPTPANVLAMCPMSCACHTKQSCDPPKLPNLLPLPHKRQIAPKTDTARSREHKDFLQKRKNQELLSCKGHQKRRTCMCEPSINPALTTTVKNPKCEHTVWGKIATHNTIKRL